MLTKEEKKEVLGESTDTGSSESQILLLSKKIEKLFAHLKENKKDTHSRRGLLKMVNDRKKLLAYLKKQDVENHKKIIAKIGLRK